MNIKNTYQLLSFASLVGLGFTAYQFIRLINQNKSDKKSNFNGNSKSIVFTLTNNTNQTQREYLFDSRSNQDNPNVTVSSNLQAFNQELSNTPKIINKIRFRTLNNVVAAPIVPPKGAAPAAPVVAPVAAISKNRQAEASFQMVCANADGNESVHPYQPFVSPFQVQQGITTLKMNDYLLDGTCYMKYKLYPNSKISMIVFYEDKPLSKLLTK